MSWQWRTSDASKSEVVQVVDNVDSVSSNCDCSGPSWSNGQCFVCNFRFEFFRSWCDPFQEWKGGRSFCWASLQQSQCLVSCMRWEPCLLCWSSWKSWEGSYTESCCRSCEPGDGRLEDDQISLWSRAGRGTFVLSRSHVIAMHRWISIAEFFGWEKSPRAWAKVFELLAACEKLLDRLVERHPELSMSFELPNSNRYWTHPKLQAFVQARIPFRSVVHACAMGIEGLPGLPIKKAFRIMSSSEELSQRLEKRFHCACDFHASFNFSDFQLSEKYSRKFARFFVRMLALLALRWSMASKPRWFYRLIFPEEKGRVCCMSGLVKFWIIWTTCEVILKFW